MPAVSVGRFHDDIVGIGRRYRIKQEFRVPWADIAGKHDAPAMASGNAEIHGNRGRPQNAASAGEGDIEPIGHRQWCVEFRLAAEIIERAQNVRQVVERLLASVAGASVLAYRAFGLFLLQVRGIEQNDSRQVAC